MKQKSLNQSILVLVVSLVLLTAISYIVSTWHATSKHAKQRLERDLEIAQNVLEQVLKNREQILYNAASVLTADFGFKQAVASTDKPTIDSVLLNHGERIEADLMILLGLNAETFTSVPQMSSQEKKFPYPDLFNEVLNNNGVTTLMIFDERLYQIVMLTVDAPLPIAVAVVGFEIDIEFIEGLKAITQLETSIQVKEGATEFFRLTSLPEEQNLGYIFDHTVNLSWFSLLILEDTQFISRQFILPTPYGKNITITLSEKLEILLAEFNQLQISIFTITVATLLFALSFAVLLSKKIAKPMMYLADTAKNIADGDYSQTIIADSTSTEFIHLVNAFKSMQLNIRNRESEIKYQAQHDLLTALYNRHHISNLIGKIFSSGKQFQAIGINIIDFRNINDVLGYHNGDYCLKVLASRISTLGGLAARLNGGEFLWIPDKPLDSVRVIKIKEMMEQVIGSENVTIKPKLTLGILACPLDATSAEELFRSINIVLDEAQVNHQTILNFQPEFEQKYLRRLSILSELIKALDHDLGQFTLFYQPKLNLRSQKVNNAEALIRWNNQKLGFVSPEEFIIIAEHAGIIEKLTSWVINQAITDSVKFKKMGFELKIAVNLSVHDILDKDLLNRIETKLSECQLTHEVISFEITESDLLRDLENAIINIKAFKQKGFEFAIDDFGTGYSSMAYLKKLPIDCLKVDKCFVLKIDKEKGDQYIVKTIIQLAHSFNLTVVAEGIENKTTLKLLQQYHCSYAQGYFISKPVPFESFVIWLKDNKKTKWLEKNEA